MTEAAAPFPNSAGTNVDILIVGAGFSGLCMGIKLLEAGMKSFLIIEKSGDIGGTWWDNRYPGCACDIPSHLYSFSFAPSTEWTRMYPGQQEIHDYLSCWHRRKRHPVPQIAPRVGRLYLFQRTPTWIVPRLDFAITDRWKRRFRAISLTRWVFRQYISGARKFASSVFLAIRSFARKSRTLPAAIARA